MFKGPYRGRLLLPGLIVLVAVASPPVVSGPRWALQAPRQPGLQYQYALGSVTISIPPPKGFEEVLSRFQDMRDRMPDTDRLENLAVHLPADVVKTFVPGQDLSFYTKVSISKAIKTSDVSETFFAGMKKEMASGKVFDAEALRKYLAEVKQKPGITVNQTVQLGVVDQTPETITVLGLMTVTAGDRKVDVLFSTSGVYLRRRFFIVYSFRMLETTKDVAALIAFTKDWVGSIVTANP